MPCFAVALGVGFYAEFGELGLVGVGLGRGHLEEAWGVEGVGGCGRVWCGFGEFGGVVLWWFLGSTVLKALASMSCEHVWSAASSKQLHLQGDYTAAL